MSYQHSDAFYKALKAIDEESYSIDQAQLVIKELAEKWHFGMAELTGGRDELVDTLRANIATMVAKEAHLEFELDQLVGKIAILEDLVKHNEQAHDLLVKDFQEDSGLLHKHLKSGIGAHEKWPPGSDIPKEQKGED